jgi:hypothetical protein
MEKDNSQMETPIFQKEKNFLLVLDFSIPEEDRTKMEQWRQAGDFLNLLRFQ